MRIPVRRKQEREAIGTEERVMRVLWRARERGGQPVASA